MDRKERRRRTARIVDRRKEVMRWDGMLEWADDRRIGRCKTLHPFDCGRPKCGVCSLHKQKGHERTRQEQKAELALKEGMAETAGPTNPHKFTGYMCGTEFFYEEGRPHPHGNQVFADVDTVKEACPCSKEECGIVEVEVSFKKWVVPPSGQMVGDNIEGEQIEWEKTT